MSDGVDIDAGFPRQRGPDKVPRSAKVNSHRAFLLVFFEANPDEELTYADIALKRGISAAAAKAVVQDMKTRGELESVHVIRLPAKGRAS